MRARDTRSSSSRDARANPRLAGALAAAVQALSSAQAPDGHWVFELEADCTIPAEYVLMMHFLGEVDARLSQRLATYLRQRQAEHGGWSLYPGGALDVSCSVKAYWALKLAGEDPDSQDMRRARQAILEAGGAARCNVFTRITMALFEQVPWRAVPFVPVEIVLLPRWFPFHVSKVSYWSRAVMVPLAVLCSLRARAANPTGLDIGELFTTTPDEEADWFPVRSAMNRIFLSAERLTRLAEPLIPARLRKQALKCSEDWILERLNGEHGLGAIFPAMVNALEALHALGFAADDPRVVEARQAIDRLLVEREHETYPQPCVSPVWDTALASLALQEARACRTSWSKADPGDALQSALQRAHVWLLKRQVRGGPADWRAKTPALCPGGWAFQYDNQHYPDLDDTSMVAWALHQAGDERFREPVERGVNWFRGMQSRNGGFASFDADNTSAYLNEIPFADHGALLDPPTADVTARCLAVLGMLGRPDDAATLDSALSFILGEQEADGSWFGRWGTNYIYGTWSVLSALPHVVELSSGELNGEHNGTARLRIDQQRAERVAAAIQRGADWLASVQRPDGGWGETNDSYERVELAGTHSRSTPWQTAWAILGLLAAGRTESPAVARGVAWLVREQGADGKWHDDGFNAPGFPRVFYLRYHGYALYFPLWALARYMRLTSAQPTHNRAAALACASDTERLGPRA